MTEEILVVRVFIRASITLKNDKLLPQIS